MKSGWGSLGQFSLSKLITSRNNIILIMQHFFVIITLYSCIMRMHAQCIMMRAYNNVLMGGVCNTYLGTELVYNRFAKESDYLIQPKVESNS